MFDKLIAIVGPTASGKTSVGSFLVESLDFSVINFDSCQLYSGLPNLTALPQDLYEHYLYSCFPYSERMNVVQWADLAMKSIELVLSKNRRPVLIGGTALYLKCFLEGIDFLPACSVEVEDFVSGLSLGEVKQLILRHDPKVLQVYFDLRRLRKALAFVLYHGFSLLDSYGRYWRRFWTRSCEVLALVPPREILLDRINYRLLCDFDAMVADVESNVDACYDSVIGFSEIKHYLLGRIQKDRCVEMIRRRTGRYAKRQVTFLKNSLSVSRFFDSSSDLQKYLIGRF